MFSANVQRILIGYLRREAPLAYAAATADLRRTYARRMKASTNYEERRVIASQYRQARAAMVIRLASLVAEGR